MIRITSYLLLALLTNYAWEGATAQSLPNFDSLVQQLRQWQQKPDSAAWHLERWYEANQNADQACITMYYWYQRSLVSAWKSDMEQSGLDMENCLAAAKESGESQCLILALERWYRYLIAGGGSADSIRNTYQQVMDLAYQLADTTILVMMQENTGISLLQVDSDSALGLLNKVRPYYKDTLTYGYASLFYFTGHAHSFLQNPVAAQHYFERSAALFAAIQDTAMWVNSLKSLAMEVSHTDTDSVARVYLERAIGLLEASRLKNTPTFLSTQYALGVLLYRQGLNTQTLAVIKPLMKHPAFATYEEKSVIVNGIAAAYNGLMMPDSAIKYGHWGVQLALQKQDRALWLDAQMRLLTAYSLQENRDSVVAHSRRLLPYRDQVQDDWEKLRLDLVLAQAALWQEEPRQALEMLQGWDSRMTDSSQVEDQLRMNYYDLLARAYAGLQQYERAYTYQRSFDTLSTVYQKKNNDRRIAELQTEFQTAEKEQQIASLQTQQALQVRNFRNLGLAGVLVLLALLVLAWQYRKQRRTKLALAQANDTKDRLFSVLAHDVRSPINNLLGVTELLELDALDVDQRRRMLAEARQRGEQVLGMLDNLLHWTRYQMEALQVTPTALPLPKLVAEVAAIYQPQAQERGITLHYSIPEGTEVQADPEVLRLVLRNLVSNSLKFTPAGGEIRISLGEAEDERCTVVVQDTGQGMDAATVQRLLVSREQHSTHGLRGEKGTGLGLRLVQDFLGHLGSQLHIESQPGQGTTFTFALPQAP